ncbi:MAG: hypothetical protein K2X77_22375 [Candidatus Obscuribacterales bacterium]|jgi:hypothetical protein|nr:hypothetical protein [Candidatus Obscuribacterales bacterium]
MASKKVGIVGGVGEHHTMHMKSVLENLGAEAVVIDTLNFPDRVTFSLRNESPVYQGKGVEDIVAFYNRTVFYSEPPYDLQDKIDAGELPHLKSWYSVYAAERERQSLLGSWLRAVAFQCNRVVNPVECFHLHHLKPHQLVMLRRAGIVVPETLVTNNPEELKEFKAQVKEVIYKPVAGGASCNLLKDEDMVPERLSLLSSAPVLFQKLHAGDDIRVFVLDGRVLCALEIETEALDYRGHEQAINVIDLPDAVAQMCIKAAEVCSMKFTGIDLKRSATGEFVMLEANPSPMFIGFQTRSGFPIDQELAKYLMG